MNTEAALHWFLTVCIGSNLSGALATYVHVGCGDGGHNANRPHPIRDAAGPADEELLVGGFRTFVEAFDDAAELHGRYVRGCRTRCTGEGERVL